MNRSINPNLKQEPRRIGFADIATGAIVLTAAVLLVQLSYHAHHKEGTGTPTDAQLAKIAEDYLWTPVAESQGSRDFNGPIYLNKLPASERRSPLALGVFCVSSTNQHGEHYSVSAPKLDGKKIVGRCTEGIPYQSLTLTAPVSSMVDVQLDAPTNHWVIAARAVDTAPAIAGAMDPLQTNITH
jgi:hypothetical protein